MVILSTLLAAATVGSGMTEGRPLQITAEYVRDGHLLRMTVVDEGTTAVDINEVWLPWGHFYSTLLVAVQPMDPIDRGRALERTFINANPMGSRITIRPGQSVKGDIELDYQFASLREALQRDHLLLFWSYVPRYVDREVGPRSGGWLLLPSEAKPAADSSGLDNRQYLDSSGQVRSRRRRVRR